MAHQVVGAENFGGLVGGVPGYFLEGGVFEGRGEDGGGEACGAQDEGEGEAEEGVVGHRFSFRARGTGTWG